MRHRRFAAGTARACYISNPFRDSGGDGLDNFVVGCSVLEHVVYSLNVLTLALPLPGQFTPFAEGVGIVRACVLFTAAVGVVIRAVRLFVVFLAVLEDVIPVLLRSSPDDITMSAGKSVFDD